MGSAAWIRTRVTPMPLRTTCPCDSSNASSGPPVSTASVSGSRFRGTTASTLSWRARRLSVRATSVQRAWGASWAASAGPVQDDASKEATDPDRMARAHGLARPFVAVDSGVLHRFSKLPGLPLCPQENQPMKVVDHDDIHSDPCDPRRWTRHRGPAYIPGMDQHPVSARWRVVAASLAELAVFLVVPSLFLMRYVGHFAGSGLAVAPHLSLIVTVWFVIVALRLWVHWNAGQGRTRLFAASLGISAFLFAGLLYYALTVAGLTYWNNVVSWELIRAYSTQIGPLSASLELPLATLGLVLVAGFGVLWGVARFYSTRWDRTRQTAARLSPMTPRAGGMALVLLVVVQAVGIGSGRWGARGEPVSPTCTPGGPSPG